MAPRIRRIADTTDLLGESPVWDERSGRLFWIDALAGLVRILDLASGARSDITLESPLGSMVLAGEGRAIVALKTEIVELDLASGQVSPIAAIEADHPFLRLNDGKVDRQGRFVVGTMLTSRTPGEPIAGGIFRLETDRTLTRLADGLAVANGPCFSRDGQTMYIADSPNRRMWRYAYGGDAPMAEPALFLDTEALQSGIDGATVDAEGFVWGALVRTGKVARFSPDGRLDRTIDMPVSHPTSLAFGGPDLDILFVTSLSRSTNLAASEAEAGGIFAVEGLGVTGLPCDRFGQPSRG